MNYQVIYDRLMRRGQVRLRRGYLERHHIKPKCLGGTDDVANIARLTPEEHFVAHLLLCKLYPQHLGLIAAVMLLATNGAKTNKLYGWLRCRAMKLQRGKMVSIDTRRKLSLALKGRVFTAEHRQRLGACNRGRKLTIEHRQKLSKAKKGVKKTPQHAANAALAKRGVKRTPEQRLRMCIAHQGLPGHPQTLETRAKISAGHLKRWAALRNMDHASNQSQNPLGS